MKERISEIQIVPIKANNGLVAFASLILDNDLYLSSIAIFTRPNGGYRLAYPTRPGPSKGFNIFHPINSSIAEQIKSAVIKKFQEVVSK